MTGGSSVSANGGNGGGYLACLDFKTGDVLWNEKDSDKRRVTKGSVAFADGRIYFQNEEGVGFVVQAGKTFELLARNELGERTLASSAVDDGTLYLRGAEHLYRIGKK